MTDSAGAPIPDASVALIDSSGRVRESGYASRNGAFRLRAVRAGSYAVFGRRLGYAPTRSDFHDVGMSDTIGIRWYGVAYLSGFAVAYFILMRLAKKGRVSIPPE